ncbi:hypothetical protein MESS4_330064 [Mesorhizobium sp. STM 4661]|nr:hypothetical protein MESS4_330064 [Mesorhizobium sp. STM 4661]
MGDWPAISDTLEGLGEPSERIDTVHFGGLQKGRDSRPLVSAAVAACKKRILSDDCLGPDRPLNDIGVDLDAAVGQEALEDSPPGRGVSGSPRPASIFLRSAAVPFPRA